MTDDRKISLEPQDNYDELIDLLRKIKKERKRGLFVLISETIDDVVADDVYSWRNEIKEANKEGGLDILIHSPGGNLSQSYIVARLLCRCVNCWEALVPERAYSGATLICLGSSNIVMSGIAQLSPLDPQVISKRREKFFAGERQSPLEAFQALQYLRQFTLTSLDAGMRFLIDRGVTPEQALQTSSTLAINLAEPILRQIEPYDLGAFALDSKVAADYCKRISDPSNKEKITQRKVPVRTLVESYPAHEFVIDIEEARALDFNVSEPAPEIDALFSQVRPHLEKPSKFIGVIK